MKFISKPATLEANQYTHPGCGCRGVEYEPVTEFTSRPFVTTIHGQKCYIEPGDWIAEEPDGLHFYPIKPDIFEKRWQKDEACIKPLTGSWKVECNVCGKVYENHTGSTPCCGSIAYIIEHNP